jgi:myo-inositol-1(or 4)-monophosphatase
MNFEDICKQVCSLAHETGIFIKSEAENFAIESIETKGLNNFVSYVDKTSEIKLVNGLRKILPEAGFIAEEGTGAKTESSYCWVIDPLDGTTNFIHGLPPYAISIGLMDGDEVVVGVIYEVSLNECFYAWKGSKAWLNGREIVVSKSHLVSDALIATGFPYTDYHLLKPFMQSLEYLFVHSHGVRRIGSAATDLAYVACGRFDAFYEYSLHPWDVAAGSLIIQQAGGKVTDFNAGNNYIFGSEIVASNSIIHSEFSKIVHNYLSKK